MIRPRIGMVLAAGRGERLRPITDKLPKPLIEIAGRTLLDHAIDRLADTGVETVVVNTHYRADQIAGHLAQRETPRIRVSHESERALETGGAVVHARDHLGADPFYVVNGDSLWLDGKVPALERLAAAFDPDRCDAMLLLQRTATAVGYDSQYGDFQLDQMGNPRWRRESEIAPYLYAGIQLVSPCLFDGLRAEPFSMRRVWGRALEKGRLGAIVHDGEWYHVSTPAGLDLVRRRLEHRRTER
jgi:MurNAc alpha-1-phosphate uridylyltransferase